MIEGTYYFGDYLRWNLWFPNPNPAGAFIAMLIPWLWVAVCAARNKWSLGHPACILLLIVEAASFYVLCKTYSRGALVALAVSGCVAVAWWLWASREKGWKAALPTGAVRAVIIAAILAGTGFFNRIAPEYLSTDRSTLNRFVLWKGGAQMVAASPWKGWGRKRSGEQFMHWFQPMERDEAYAGMVNSYLHVGVERGLPFILGIAAVGGTLILAGLGSAMKEPSTWKSILSLGGALSLVVFAAANVSSTLWIFRDVWWPPTIAALAVLVGMVWGIRNTVGSFVLAVVGCLVGGVAVYGYGKSAGDSAIAVQKHEEGVILCKRGAAVSGIEILLPDADVLGEAYGKALRELVASAPDGYCVFVPDSDLEGFPEGATEVVAFGDRCREVEGGSSQLPITLVHPTVRLENPEDLEKVGVVLPGIASGSELRRWKRLAKKHGWDVFTNQGISTDLQPRWPDIYWEFMGEGGSL